MIFRKNPQVVLVVDTFIDNKHAGKTVKVIKSGPDWFRRIVLGVAIPLGLWIMVMNGAFR